MSDCSTEAMKPKAKTCGNCDKFVRAKGCEHLGICSEIYFEDEYGDDAFAAVRDTRQCDNPSLFKPRTGTLEQRCQQLEQVAWELYAIAITTWKEARVLAGPQMKRSVERREEHLNRLKEQLEALGVSLDD